MPPRLVDRFPSTAATLGLLTLLSLPACGGGGEVRDASEAGPEVVRSMDGDTSVVRTVSGSVWGRTASLVQEVSIGVLEGAEPYMFGDVRSIEVAPDGRIFVLDGQSLEIRVFSPDGTFVETWGRDGEGPGELGRPDGGLTMLSDGRLVVRDPGNARLQVFDAGGEHDASWPVISGGFSTSTNFSRWGDSILNPRVINLEEARSVEEWRSGFELITPDGAVIDTLPYPTSGFEQAAIMASREGSSSRNSVPFAPGEELTWHPDGFFVIGISDDYSFTLLRPGAPLRIERAWDPVPVAGGERAQEEAVATRNLRRLDPNWRWNGPPIPDAKPAFDAIFTGRDGRIWLRREGPGYQRDDPDYDPTDPEDIEERWTADALADVFEPDGTFLGSVQLPTDFFFYPTPIFDGERVWAVTRDDFGVQRVVRYRIEVGA